MDAPAAKTPSERLRRFLRWFFTASPDAGVEPPPITPATLPRRTRRTDPPRLRAQHAGRVGLRERGKS